MHGRRQVRAMRPAARRYAAVRRGRLGSAAVFWAQKYKMRQLKAPKKNHGTPSEEGSCVKVAGGASMDSIPGVFISDEPVLAKFLSAAQRAKLEQRSGARRWCGRSAVPLNTPVIDLGRASHLFAPLRQKKHQTDQRKKSLRATPQDAKKHSARQRKDVDRSPRRHQVAGPARGLGVHH